MALEIVSQNLLIKGDKGKFEADPSTWGIILKPGVTQNGTVIRYTEMTRSMEYKLEGNNSMKATVLKDLTTETTGWSDMQLLFEIDLPITAGKKYVFKARCYVPSTNPPGNDAANMVMVSFMNSSVTRFYPVEALGDRFKILACKDTWKDFDYYFTALESTPYYSMRFIISVHSNYGGSGGAIIVNGAAYFDKFELFELAEVDDQTPEEPQTPPGEKLPVFFFRNPIPFQISQNINNANLSNYTLYNQVYIEKVNDSNNFLPALSLELEPDSLGKALFYLNEAFRDSLSPEFPDKSQTEVKRIKNTIKRFKCFYGDFWEDQEAPAILTPSGIMYVVYGGLSKTSFPEIDYFGDFLTVYKKFLTWQPKVKTIDKVQEEYLYFFVYALDISSLRVRIKVYYDGVTTPVTYNGKLISGTQYGHIYCIPSGYTNAGIGAFDETKVVLKYDLWLENEALSPVSEVRTYIIDPETHPNTKYFLFVNSLGGVDTLRTVGKASLSQKTDKELAERFLPHDYTVEDGQYFTNESTFVNPYEISTGFVNKETAHYLQELSISRKVFYVNPSTLKRLPVNIKADDFTIIEDDNFKYFYRFKYEIAYKDHSYTPEIIAEEIPQAPQVDTLFLGFGTDGKVWKSVNSGETWGQISKPSSSMIEGAVFVSPLVGYVTTGAAYKTNDGGVTWQGLPGNGNFYGNIDGVYFVSETVGFLFRLGEVLKTIDSGGAWTVQDLPVSQIVNAMRAKPDGSQVFAVGNALNIFKNTLSGNVWESVSHPVTVQHSLDALTDVFFISNVIGFIVGAKYNGTNKNILLQTTDGGETWEDITTSIPSGTGLRLINFPTATLGYIGSENGKIYKTIDSGFSWLTITTPTGYDIMDLTFLDVSKGFITDSAGRVFSTIDGGETWKDISPSSGINLIIVI